MPSVTAERHRLLRHGHRSVITTIGLSRTSAEHITNLLAEPEIGLDKT